MQQTTVTRPMIQMVGITARTNNALEMNPLTAQIGATVQRYFHNACAEKIAHRKKPGTTYCVYTAYDSDFTGYYTYYIGEEVTSFDDLSEGLSALTMPAQSYIKFTSEPGAMPDVCLQMWHQIWSMSATELGGERSYTADFEIYDERAHDPASTVLDIYIAV